jgi:murein DD-endopeptidase MepM/ murein hydrolase activator NlpD
MTFDRNQNGLLAGFLNGTKMLTINTGAVAGRLLNLKQRYILTRRGHLRLRFMVTPVVFFFAGIAVITAFTPPSNAVLPIDYYAESTGRPTKEFSSMLDGSLYGQLSLVSAMSGSLPQPTDKIVTVEPGDALGSVMERAGVGSKEASEVVTAMKDKFDPRRLKAGQDVQMHFVPVSAAGEMEFTHMKIAIDPIKTLVVSRGDAGFASAIEEKAVERKVRAQRANIEVSLYGSAEKAGIPASVISEAIRIYSWNVDFQRDIRQGDKLEVMYDSYETEDGYVAKTGEVVYAKLTLGGKDISLYRYETADGRVDYFGPDGRSIRRTLLSTPIDGARMSSGFGMRRHPVLGYGKMHKGVDFAAPTGTPIYAAGDGTVEKAGRFSSYGNYVRIRHNNDIKTAYAHMSRIAAKAGARVRQGDVIGYVGTTGRSTGPHLHYEVMRNNKQVNPRSIDLPTGESLEGKDLKNFKDKLRGVDQEYANLTDGIKFAQNRAGDVAPAKRYN